MALPRIIPILGEKWDKCLEKWRNGKGRYFQQAHEEYLANHLGRGNVVPNNKHNKKRFGLDKK